MKTRIRIVFLAVLISLVVVIFTLLGRHPSPLQLPDFSGGIVKRLQDWQERFNATLNDLGHGDGLLFSGVEKPLISTKGAGRVLTQLEQDEGRKDRLEDAIGGLRSPTTPPPKEPLGLPPVAEVVEDAVKDPSLPDKVVVMGKLHSDDTSWVERELTDWQHAIYVVDPLNATLPLPAGTLYTPLNKGREAMPYLTYIIDHYQSLPSVMAFIHPHRDGYPIAWHTDAPSHSNVYSLQNLKTDYIQKAGYANLRCSLEPGCPAEVRPFTAAPTKEPEAHMAAVWPELFPDQAENIPEIIGAACCAQFAVSADQVRQRPIEDYVRIRRWIQETELDDYTSGRVMEYTWHIIFGQSPVNCPTARDCYCNVYGRRCRNVSPIAAGGGARPKNAPGLPPLRQPINNILPPLKNSAGDAVGAPPDNLPGLPPAFSKLPSAALADYIDRERPKGGAIAGESGGAPVIYGEGLGTGTKNVPFGERSKAMWAGNA